MSRTTVTGHYQGGWPILRLRRRVGSLLLSLFYFPVRRADPLFRLRDDLRRGCSSARWERRTGERSGNWPTMCTSPPIPFTVFRSLESSRSLRFSSRETLSWGLPRVLATRLSVTLR